MKENTNKTTKKDAKKPKSRAKILIMSAPFAVLALALIPIIIIFGKCIIGVHNFEYASDATTHYMSCASCGKQTDSVDHSFDRFENCTVCGMNTPPTEGISYRASADGTYAEAESLVSKKTKIKISSGFNNLPVKGIKASAFEKTDITSAIISEGVEYIGLSSFEGCISLENVVIPNSLTSIGTNSFKNCKSLVSIVIPKSVERINNGAFEGCDALADIYFTGSKAEWESIYKSIDNDVLSSATIHYNYVP